jgi:hypothetical protein
MRNVLAFVAALGIVVAIFWLTRSKDAPVRPPPSVASGSAPKVAPTVRRLDKAQHTQLRAQIAEAREKARAAGASSSSPSSSSSSPPPALPDDTMKLEDLASMQEALKQTVPILAECYADEAGVREALAQLTLTTNPELGTVIDTTEIKDANGQPLAPKLDTCLRDTIDSLALPPLGDKAGKLLVQYTFSFD